MRQLECLPPSGPIRFSLSRTEGNGAMPHSAHKQCEQKRALLAEHLRLRERLKTPPTITGRLSLWAWTVPCERLCISGLKRLNQRPASPGRTTPATGRPMAVKLGIARGV
jgi:hypothetical protein